MKQHLLMLMCFLLSISSQAQPTQTITGADIEYGKNVALSANGNFLVISDKDYDYDDGFGSANQGLVRVYERNLDNTWSQKGADIVGTVDAEGLGTSITISEDGNTLIASSSLNYGRVRTYTFSSNIWVMKRRIDGTSGNTFFGEKVAISEDGKFLAISDFERGLVYIYRKSVSITQVWSWIQENIFFNPTGNDTEDFGASLSLSSPSGTLEGTVVVIGAPLYNTTPGRAYVYSYVGNNWTNKGNPIEGDDNLGDPRNKLGSSVSLSSDGNLLAIGINDTRGSVEVYQFEDTNEDTFKDNWVQKGQSIVGDVSAETHIVDLLSNGMLHKSILAIGGYYDESGAVNDTGIVRVYQYDENEPTNNKWISQMQIQGTMTDDYLGFSVALATNTDGVTTLAAGAPQGGIFGQASVGDGYVDIHYLPTITLSNSNKYILENFNIFPNPGKGKITIHLGNGLQLQQLNLYNNLGQRVGTYNTYTIDTSNLNSSVYILEVITKDGKRAAKKLVIE